MRSHCRIVNGGGVHRLQGKWAAGEDEDGAGIVVVSEELLEGGGMGRVLDRAGVGGWEERADLNFAFWSLFAMSSFALSWFLPLSPTILLPWVSMLARGVPLPKPPSPSRWGV